MKMGQRLKIVSKETGELCAAFRMCRLSERSSNSLPEWDEGYMKSYMMNHCLEEIIMQAYPEEFKDLTKIAKDNGACVDKKYRGN
jgi:hypothetical protein